MLVIHKILVVNQDLARYQAGMVTTSGSKRKMNNHVAQDRSASIVFDDVFTVPLVYQQELRGMDFERGGSKRTRA